MDKRVILEKGHISEAFQFAISGFNYYKNNPKIAGSRAQNIIYLTTLVNKYNMTGAPSWAEFHTVLREETPEFIDWLSSQNVDTAYIFVQNTNTCILPNAPEAKKKVENLYIVLKHCVPTSKLAQTIRQNIFTLQPTLALWKDIFLTHAFDDDWPIQRQSLLKLATNPSLEYIDILLSDR